MNLQLKGYRALVTGSTAGIGFAIAKQLAQEGATVIINGRTALRVDAAIEKIIAETGNELVSGITADFAQIDQINSLIANVPEVDILVNNVAVFEPRAFTDITDAEWLNIFELNVLSGIRLSRAYFSGMIKRNKGRIIFISSGAAVQIPAEFMHYGMSKLAQLAISRGLAELTKGTNVTVNSVLPGPTLSEGVGGFIEKLARDTSKSVEELEEGIFKTSSLIQRFLSTDEVANIVTYLASPLSIATNGAVLRADGGSIKSII